MVDEYRYEDTVGGWHACNICSARVDNPVKHTEFHQGLMNALMAVLRGEVPSFGWNFPHE